MPTHIEIQKEENWPMDGIQWTRKEVTSFFSTFQSPSRLLPGMDALDTTCNVSDSSNSPLGKKSESLSLFSEHQRQQLLSAPAHHQGSLFLQWMGRVFRSVVPSELCSLLNTQEKCGLPPYWLFLPNTNTEASLIWVGLFIL